MSTPVPRWYVVLRDVADDEGSPPEVAQACREAIAYVDAARQQVAVAHSTITDLTEAYNVGPRWAP